VLYKNFSDGSGASRNLPWQLPNAPFWSKARAATALQLWRAGAPEISFRQSIFLAVAMLGLFRLDHRGLLRLWRWPPDREVVSFPLLRFVVC